MTTLELLIKTRETLTIPERWYKGAYGGQKGKDGKLYQVMSTNADILATCSCWCLLGALVMNVGDGGFILSATKAIQKQMEKENIGYRMEQMDYPIAPWQDRPETTHADLLGLLDHTIATVAKQEEQAP